LNRNVINMLMAFLLIIVCFRFFTSRMYYEKILKKPYPFENKQVINEEKGESAKDISESTSVVNGKVDRRESVSNINEPIETPGTDTTTLDTVSSDTLTVIDTIYVETDKYICAISEMGGRIITLKTKEYTYKHEKNKNDTGFIELLNFRNKGGGNLKINDKNYDNKIFKYTGDEKKIVVENDSKVTLTFSFIDLNESAVKKEFTFFKNNYTIGYSVISDEIIDKKVEIGWEGGIKESEIAAGRSARFDKKKIHFLGGDEGEHMEGNKEEEVSRSGNYNWVAITSKYFAVALIPEKISDGTFKVDCYYDKKEENKKKNEREISLSVSVERFSNNREEKYTIYAGPTKLNELKLVNVKLEKILFGVSTKTGKVFATVFIGGKVWFPKLCEFVLWLLIQLQKGVKDYGIVIIILTIILKVVTYPLTQSSMKSMSKMKEIQPRINKIREKYKGNPQQMNQKIMEFYRKEGINPLGGMGGCLPMILQMPIMISLFIVLRKAIELRGQGTFLVPWIKDLSQAEVLFPIGVNIPMYGSNFALLPVVMAVLMYFQNKSTIKDPNQKAMIYMMPIMMLVLFNNFPSGLCLYFTFSTALQLVQQKLMDKKKKESNQ